MKKLLTFLVVIISSFQIYCQCTTITSLPYNESFDTVPIVNDDFPICWTKINTYPYYDIPFLTSNFFYSAPKSLCFFSTSNSFNIASTPQIDNSIQINTLRVKFRLLKGMNNNKLDIGVMTNPNDVSTFVQIEELSPLLIGTWTQFEVYFNNYTGNGKYIAFKSATTNDNVVYFDDVEVSLIPSCPTPTELTVDTNSLTTSSATINWVSRGNEMQWTLQYKPSSDTSWNNAITINNITIPTCTLSALTNSPQYDVRIKSICSPIEESEWSNILTFRTSCNVIKVLPWYDYFNTYGYGYAYIFPNYWTRINTNNNSSYSIFPNITNGDNSSKGSLYFESDSLSYNIASTPQIDTSLNINTLRLKFKLMRQFYNNNKLSIGVMTDPNNASTFTQVAEFSPIYPDTWTPFEVNFDNYTGNGKYIAFKSGTTRSNKIYLEDIEISLIPLCQAPTNIIVNNITTTSATINWTPSGNETQWELQYKPSSEVSWNNATIINNITSSMYSISGLYNTQYDVRVRAICSPSEESEWSIQRVFRTTCSIISTLPWYDSFDTYGVGDKVFPICWSRNNSLYVPFIISHFSSSSPGALVISSNSSNFTIATTPQIDSSLLVNELRIKFKLFKTDNQEGILSIGVMTDPSDASTFTHIVELSPIALRWTDYEVSLASYIGNGKYIAFKSGTTSSNTIYLDDIEISKIPSCLNPTSIISTDISTNSAKINWTPNGNETQWRLFYRKSLNQNWNYVDVNVHPYNLTGLIPNTDYEVKLETLCSDSTYSEESQTIGFNTVCDDTIININAYICQGEIYSQNGLNVDSSGIYTQNLQTINGCDSIVNINLTVNPTPDTVSNLNVQLYSNYLGVTWQSNSDSCEIYRNDSLISTTNQNMYLDYNVLNGTEYCYKIKSIVGNCESDFSNIVCNSFIGLSDISKNLLEITLSPNPTSGKAYLYLEGLNSNADVKVYDIYGRLIIKYNLNPAQTKLEIDVNDFSKGMYNINVINNEFNITKKLIVR